MVPGGLRIRIYDSLILNEGLQVKVLNILSVCV